MGRRVLVVFTGDVIGLDLSCTRFYGTIDTTSSLFFLPYLQSLNLALVDFNKSTILAKFGQFRRMTHLNLSSSGFQVWLLEKSPTYPTWYLLISLWTVD